MKLVDKDAVIAMIKHHIKEEHHSYFCKCLLSELDTIGVKEVDLEKELDSMITPELKFHKALPSLFDVAKHFFELGIKAAQKGE